MGGSLVCLVFLAIAAVLYGLWRALQWRDPE